VSGLDITLDQLSDGAVTVVQNLPAECQKLYYNVTGPNIRLDKPLPAGSKPSDDFEYNFVAAIQFGIDTPGFWCHEKLKYKAGFAQTDPKSAYIRITLGYDLADSFGPPFVLEIWPAGHYSSIYDHAKLYAIMKVHGR